MASARRRCLGCILVTLAWGAPARAQGVAGIVVDPQDRRIVGASVILACARTTLQTTSDASGHFAFGVEPGTERCTLRVKAPGFGVATMPAECRAGQPIAVRLDLEPLAEAIEVRVARPTTAGALALGRDEMRRISDDPAEILRVAKALAGPAADYPIYVDGFPAQQLPPVSRIATLAVGADPFSSEYSDSGPRRIDVVTQPLSRRWTVHAGGSPPDLATASPLGDRSRSRSLRGGLSGPTPWEGGAFSFHADTDTLEGERAVIAASPAALSPVESAGAPADAWSPSSPGTSVREPQLGPYGATHRSVSVQFEQRLATGGSASIGASRTLRRISNAGAGAEVLPEAGLTLNGASTELRVLVHRDSPGISWRSQLQGGWDDNAMGAITAAPAMVVHGAFVGGGAATAWSETSSHRLFWKNTAASSNDRLPWRAGLVVERLSEERREVPNAAGSVQLSSAAWRAALEGAPVATAFRSPGSMQRVALLNAAAFAEATPVHRPNLRIVTGMRADWQSSDKVRISPRLSASWQHHAWTLGGGIGSFAQAWPPPLFLGTGRASGTRPVILMAREVSLDSATRGDFAGSPIVMDVAPGFRRASYLVSMQSLERPVAWLSVGVEHVWRRGTHMAGGQRLADEASGGWVDWLESNRRLDSHELRVRLSTGGSRRQASVTYGWTHSSDNTDGGWSFPARQGNLAAEWARSARVAAHGLDAVASTALPAGVHLTAVATLRGESPYDVVSGLDAESNGLYTDRGGLPRNSGRLPGSRLVALYLHRRFDLAPVLGRRAALPLDAGLQVENAFGGHIWTSVGNVLGSPLYGRPQGAMPGRSIRAWFALAR